MQVVVSMAVLAAVSQYAAATTYIVHGVDSDELSGVTMTPVQQLVYAVTNADLDIAGRPRLKDGEIDVGCYQCWLKQLGLLMIVR